MKGKKKFFFFEISDTKFSIFCPIPERLKTRKSQKFCLPQIFTPVVTQDLETPNK